MSTRHFDVIVIGGGQAGLATGYFLARRGMRFTILEAHERIGESWRRRWDALRLFTSARFDSLPGMPFPAPPHSFPAKDEVADYLEAYARRMALPIRTGVRVDALAYADDGQGVYVIDAGDDRFEAPQVVVASGAFHEPRIPDFAAELDQAILQLHSSEYRNVGQLRPGGVLVVGASNSGGEIAYDVAKEHETWLSGRDTGQMPFDIDGRVARLLDPAFWFFVSHVVTVRTPIGRSARPLIQQHGGPLERVRRHDLAAAGVKRVIARTVGARNGRPELEDGQVLEVRNVIWATGFRREYPWIRVPAIGPDGWPIHERGVVPGAPGLYFVGLPFQYAFTSMLLGGVGRDARFVVDRIAERAAEGRRPRPESQARGAGDVARPSTSGIVEASQATATDGRKAEWREARPPTQRS
jgi:putative flavoprotein involved in K+ transport